MKTSSFSKTTHYEDSLHSNDKQNFNLISIYFQNYFYIDKNMFSSRLSVVFCIMTCFDNFITAFKQEAKQRLAQKLFLLQGTKFYRQLNFAV